MPSESRRGGSSDSRMDSLGRSADGQELASSSDNRRSSSTHKARQPHPMQKTMKEIARDETVLRKNTKLQTQTHKQFTR